VRRFAGGVAAIASSSISLPPPSSRPGMAHCHLVEENLKPGLAAGTSPQSNRAPSSTEKMRDQKKLLSTGETIYPHPAGAACGEVPLPFIDRLFTAGVGGLMASRWARRPANRVEKVYAGSTKEQQR